MKCVAMVQGITIKLTNITDNTYYKLTSSLCHVMMLLKLIISTKINPTNSKRTDKAKIFPQNIAQNKK